MVYRRDGGDFVAVEVTVGRNSVSRIVVETGLRPGDHVALRDPSRKATPASGAGAAAGPAEAPR